jgi:hypothetical protein
MRIADLGRNLRVPEEIGALGPKPFAEHDFACSAAVSVRGVEPSNAYPPGMIE